MVKRPWAVRPQSECYLDKQRLICSIGESRSAADDTDAYPARQVRQSGDQARTENREACKIREKLLMRKARAHVILCQVQVCVYFFGHRSTFFETTEKIRSIRL